MLYFNLNGTSEDLLGVTSLFHVFLDWMFILLATYDKIFNSVSKIQDLGIMWNTQMSTGT